MRGDGLGKVIDPGAANDTCGTAVVKTPQMSDLRSADWGTGWHHFRIHIKFNSGTTSQNEVPNGEFYLEIDGKVYADATGIHNRNPANGPINYIEFFGWAHLDRRRLNSGTTIFAFPPVILCHSPFRTRRRTSRCIRGAQVDEERATGKCH
jgi:hypothetical protein